MRIRIVEPQEHDQQVPLLRGGKQVVATGDGVGIDVRVADDPRAVRIELGVRL
jgi:hypothetical protein